MSLRRLSLGFLAAGLFALGLASRAEQDTPPEARSPLGTLAATEAPLAFAAAEVEPVEPFELAGVDGASTRYDRRVTIRGAGFYGTSFGPFVAFDGVESGSVVILGPDRIEAHVPEAVRGAVRVTVTVPDGRSVERVVTL